VSLPCGIGHGQTASLHDQRLLLHRNAFSIRGETENCSALVERREHLLIGISPFNSRFSPSYVEALVGWARSGFDQIDILLPSEEDAARLLLASGVAPSKAAQKTRKEIGRRLRSAHSAILKAGADPLTIRVFQFSDFCADRTYQSIRTQVQEAFDRCEKFRSACVSMTHQVVDGRLQSVVGERCALTREQVSDAIPYIFAEIPFYLNTPALLGVASSILAYHRPWPIGAGLFAGAFPLKVSPAQGHGVVTSTASWDRDMVARRTSPMTPAVQPQRITWPSS